MLYKGESTCMQVGIFEHIELFVSSFKQHEYYSTSTKNKDGQATMWTAKRHNNRDQNNIVSSC